MKCVWVLAAMGMFVGAAHGQTAAAGEILWKSPTTKTELHGRLVALSTAGPVVPTVIYLTNLAAPRAGKEEDAKILASFAEQGCQVVVLDYGNDAAAISPGLNADINQLRQDITGKGKFLAQQHVDVSHLYILPEGCRLKRDIPFYRVEGEAEHVWAMDLFYPANAEKKPPLLMEITCDNANRMGAGSLAFCHDTLIEGALLRGFATAMVDHPVIAPYKGMFPMPDSLERMKAAVRTLRVEGAKGGASDRVGVIGFSRGSPQAALLAVTNGRKAFEVGGMNQGVSSDVQAALIHGERYDFMALTEVDGMYKRFETAWGTRADKPEVWDTHSAIRYVAKDTPPMFLNTSDKEEVTYREQLALFERKLTQMGVEHVYQVDADGRGHRVTTDPATLQSIYDFFQKRLGG
jgi:hypothetical protein